MRSGYLYLLAVLLPFASTAEEKNAAASIACVATENVSMNLSTTFSGSSHKSFGEIKNKIDSVISDIKGIAKVMNVAPGDINLSYNIVSEKSSNAGDSDEEKKEVTHHYNVSIEMVTKSEEQSLKLIAALEKNGYQTNYSHSLSRSVCDMPASAASSR